MGEALFALCMAAGAGVFLICVAHRTGIPSIVLLLLGGVLLGPEGLSAIDPAVLGQGIEIVVGLAVAVVLFEGGLTLDWRSARQSLEVISRVLTIGVLVTWLGASWTVYCLFQPSIAIAALCGSLVVVTGPTVVAPILRRVNVRDRIKHVLYWESVAVDAIGVCLAVLCYEWISPDDAHGTWSPVVRFVARFAVGLGLGCFVGAALVRILRSHWIADEHANIVVLTVVLVAYSGAELALPESGVLAVIVAGFVVGTSRPRQLTMLKRFELELTELGIATLFVILAGTLRFDSFEVLGWRLAIAVLVLMFVVRPLAIGLSTWGRDFRLEERLFLGWMAPRGIVAAFLASHFALELGSTDAYRDDALLIHTFTFAVIGSTVVIQGMTAPMVARLLHLEGRKAQTWLLTGNDSIVPFLVQMFQKCEIPAIGLVRSPPPKLDEPSTQLLHGDPLDRNVLNSPWASDVAAVIAVSSSPYFGELVTERWTAQVGATNCYCWSDARLPQRETERLVGHPIWNRIGGPSQIGRNLESGVLATQLLRVTGSNAKRIGRHEAPLLRIRGNDVHILSDASNMNLQPGDRVAVIRERIVGLAGLVVDAVILPLANIHMEDAIDALLAEAQHCIPDLPRTAMRNTIMEREHMMSTAMGAGIAIPHAYHPSIERPQCFLASVPGCVVGPTPDGEPIRLVFLVLSPQDQATSHLRSLAAIARLSSDIEYLRDMQREQDPEQLLNWVRGRE